MKGKMKAAVLHKPLDLRVEEVSIPQIDSNEVLVKMKRVGVCGSDIHFYLEGSIASFIVKKPLILGHECAGEIMEIGDEVKNLKIGQRVVIEPGFTCGKCEYCKTGRYNLCREVKFYAAPPYDGAFAEYISAPEQNVYVMPDEMSYEEGAMIEPLAVGMMATKMGEVMAQDIVAVLGAGPIGQMALQVQRLMVFLKYLLPMSLTTGLNTQKSSEQMKSSTQRKKILWKKSWSSQTTKASTSLLRLLAHHQQSNSP